MFTTIAKLRSSSAMQSRVTTVENWLKRQNANWQPTDKFPIFAIANSNVVDDVDWVVDVTSTHVAWPEMEKAVLAEFGHTDKRQHLDFITTELRRGKTKALGEITPKYNAAYLKVHATEPNPLSPGAAPASAPTASASAAAPNLQQVAQDSTEAALVNVAPAATEASTATTTEASKPISVVPDFSVAGAFYIAIGKIMVSKARNFDDAVKYANSPTGGRLYSEYAMAEGVDGKAARDYVRQYLAQQATPAQA